MERLCSDIKNQRIATPLGEVTITMSVGLAQFDYQDSGPDCIVGRADHLLYEAKLQGRDRVVKGEK